MRKIFFQDLPSDHEDEDQESYFKSWTNKFENFADTKQTSTKRKKSTKERKVRKVKKPKKESDNDEEESSKESPEKYVARFDGKKKWYDCTICSNTYTRPHNLKVHIETVHEGKKQEFKCSVCEEVFKSAFLLKGHVAFSHEGKELFECPTCKAKFKAKEED